jgi:hypothetical protein
VDAIQRLNVRLIVVEFLLTAVADNGSESQTILNFNDIVGEFI